MMPRFSDRNLGCCLRVRRRSPEGIPTNILSDRLQRLEGFGLAEKSRYQETPARFEYRLTAKGAELLPVLQEICRWANRHLPDTWKTPKSFIELKSSEIISKAGSMAAKARLDFLGGTDGTIQTSRPRYSTAFQSRQLDAVSRRVYESRSRKSASPPI